MNVARARALLAAQPDPELDAALNDVLRAGLSPAELVDAQERAAIARYERGQAWIDRRRVGRRSSSAVPATHRAARRLERSY